MCQLLVKKSRRLSPNPTVAAGRQRIPVVTSTPTAISTSATPTPEVPGCGMANARNRKPHGVPWNGFLSFWGPCDSAAGRLA